MLSSSFDIMECIEKLDGFSYRDIILMMDSEATAAERRYYKMRRKNNCDDIACYAGYIKDIILFMRYGVRTRPVRNLALRFDSMQ